MLWSVDTRDWDGRSTAAVVERVLAEAQPGGIVLMHDVKANSRAAVPEILDALLGKGYALVTVSELLGSDLTPGRVYTHRSGTADLTGGGRPKAQAGAPGGGVDGVSRGSDGEGRLRGADRWCPRLPLRALRQSVQAWP